MKERVDIYMMMMTGMMAVVLMEAHCGVKQ